MADFTILDWAVAFIRYKDSVQGKIKEILPDKANGKIAVKFKDDTAATYICTDKLESLDVAVLKDEKIACLNKKENLNWLIDNWDKLKDKKCVFFFVNLARSESWAINPFMHHSITDRAALKPGLKSLFESIPEAN